MNHEKERIFISEYIDAELDVALERKLFAHLSGCDSCRQFLRHSLKLRTDLLDEHSEVSALESAIPVDRTLVRSKYFVAPGLLSIRKMKIPVPIAVLFFLVMFFGGMYISSIWPGGVQSVKDNTGPVMYMKLPEVRVVANLQHQVKSK